FHELGRSCQGSLPFPINVRSRALWLRGRKSQDQSSVYRIPCGVVSVATRMAEAAGTDARHLSRAGDRQRIASTLRRNVVDRVVFVVRVADTGRYVIEI